MNDNSFDLEKAIAAWRRPFEYDRTFSGEDLEELESSLRDRVEALVDKGLAEEEAFGEALRRMGSYAVAEEEFRKVFWGKRRQRRELLHELNWRVVMLKNHLIIAYRNLRRHPGLTFINLFGLTVGITCCLLILLYVRHELSYDRFHEKIDRIYRVAVEARVPGSTFDNALSSAPMAPALLKDYPDILAAVRFHPSLSELLVSYADRRFYEDRFFYADASVFEVFTFPLLKGNPETVLQDPSSVVITERIAQKYFGNEDPVGRMLTVDHEHTYTVTGVMKNIPANSHLQFDFLASFSSLEAIMGEALVYWTYNPFFTYVLLPPGFDAEAFNTKLSTFVDRHVGEQLATINWKLTAFLQPLHEIHLHPLANEQQGDIRYVYVFSAIALLILLIACINFMNLSTARSAMRAREVGVRKVLGAQRAQLAQQFLSESLLTTGLAALVAVGLTILLLPAFGTISGKELGVQYSEVPALAVGLAGIILLVGLFSGSYSAFIMTGFRPVEVLKTRFTTTPGSPTLRKGLVVFQFTISVFLLVGTAVVMSQLEYMRNRKLGFDKEQVLVVPVKDSLVLARQETIKAELLQNASITEVAFASVPPGRGAGGTIARRLDNPDRPPEIKVLFIDPDFVETLDIEMAAGRDFSAEVATDVGQSILLNETAVRSFGWSRPEEAVGQPLQYSGDGDQEGTIIGVVRDFNFQPLRYGMQPLLLLPERDAYECFIVRIAPGDVERAIVYLQTVWSRVAPQWPFEYTFLNEELDALYRGEQRLGQLFGYFAGLAIFIACLGLFSLVTFTAQQRTKEIGVRKVLGASVTSIVTLLSKDFVRLVLIAAVLAAPVSYYVMSRWLEDFAYRINLSVWTFVLAGLVALAIALLTVSYQAIKAALADPVKSLRYE